MRASAPDFSVMNYPRRQFIQTMGLGMAGYLTAGANGKAAPASTGTPNIVVILSDDLGYGSLACYGAPGLKTPACDRLAREGRRFTYAYAPGSVCSPSRYGIMTGRYIWRTPVNNGFGLGDADPLLIEKGRATLASIAKAAGYNTAAIGKWHIGLGVPTTVPKSLRWDAPLDPGPLAVGFDYFFGIAANVGNQPDAYIEQDYLVNRIPGHHVTIEGKGKDAHTVGISPLRKPDEVMGLLTDKALAWLDKTRDHPFFLYFAPNAVHDPITPSAKFHDSPLGKYGDFIQELDSDVGRVLDFLDKNGLADNTIVIFTSDNGGVVAPDATEQMFAVKAGLKINGDLRGGKHSIWEGGFREPFIVRWPGKVPAGTVCNDIVCHTDILATMAAILNVPLPENGAEDSFNVLPSWLGAEGDHPPRDTVILHAPQGCTYAVRMGPWKFIENENRPEPNYCGDAYIKKSIETWRTKLKPPKDQLFNLDDDPGERTDVAAAHQDIVQQCRAILKAAREKNRTRPG
jgi:arylsulfatase A-like enzyme